MELVFKTEAYEGPLDLLLALIAKNKMNIADIKIAVIFEQYMEYVENMEVAGEFIRMASELMLIKSKMLLPKQDEDPREELVRTLMEYKAAKEAAEKLSVLEKEFVGRFEKDSDEIVIDKTKLDDMDIALLSEAMTRILMKISDKRELEKTKPIEAINPLIKKQIVPVSERIVHVMRVMMKKKRMNFEELFDDAKTRSGIIATFYAVLELLKSGRVEIDREASDAASSNIVIRFVGNKKENDDGQRNDDGQ
ncbi:MAG: segregation/condensation protein A [Clostridia bacterium]|nr:segregation/condensation protein A [Clostridia bacterium]